MEQSKKMETVKKMLSSEDKLQLLNHILTKQNQIILDQLHEDTKEKVQSVFDEEEQRWLDNYIKEHNLDQFLEMIDID